MFESNFTNISSNIDRCSVCLDLPIRPDGAGFGHFTYGQLVASSKSGCFGCTVTTRAVETFPACQDHFEDQPQSCKVSVSKTTGLLNLSLWPPHKWGQPLKLLIYSTSDGSVVLVVKQVGFGFTDTVVGLLIGISPGQAGLNVILRLTRA